jgi:hypothetical protein
MVRRAAIVLVALCLMSPAGLGHAESPEADRGGIAGLEDRLKSGLRVQAPRDVKFVETVATKVREGRLPEKLVDSTYLWAVRRGKKYPFPAFEHVIRLQAAKLGVPLE